MKSFLSFLLLIGSACAVSYNIINDNFQPSLPCNNGIPDTFSYTSPPVDPNANGDALVTLTVFGDHSFFTEYIDITCEGFAFGPFLNQNPGDDLWTDSIGDTGNDCGSPLTGTATIPLAQLTPMVADGVVQCSLTAGPDINCFCASQDVLLVFDYPVGVPGGGDPYFMGFDNQIFKFDGIVSHDYNLISSPKLQFNVRMDRGISSDSAYTMKTVVREVAVMWESYYIRFSIDSHGRFNASVFDGQFLNEIGQLGREQFQLGEMKLDWLGSVNYIKQNAQLHMSPHQMRYQLNLSHPQFIIELYAVEAFIMNSKFFFVDMEVELRDGAECFEGVWGRTSCVNSHSPFNQEEYDLRGNLLGCNFPRNLFLHC